MIKNNLQLVVWVVKWIGLIYVLIGLLLFLLPDYFLFHPVKLAAGYRYHFNMPFQEIDIPFNTKSTISLVKFFPVQQPARGVVIYFHGNKGNINRYAPFAANFTKWGYEVWMPDYPGFGKSTGERNEKILYQQAALICLQAKKIVSPKQLIIYGKSFGSGIAAQLASQQDCAQLILETPYFSIPDLLDYYAPIYPNAILSNYKIPTNQFLQQVKYPITIFHGTADGVIPYRCAAKLKRVLKPNDQFITLQNGTHHNLNDYVLFHQQLDSLLQ